MSRMWCLLVIPLKRHSDNALICGEIDKKHCHEYKNDFHSPYHVETFRTRSCWKRHLYLWKFITERYTAGRIFINLTPSNAMTVKSHDLILIKKSHYSNRASSSGQLDKVNVGDIVMISKETQQEVLIALIQRSIIWFKWWWWRWCKMMIFSTMCFFGLCVPLVLMLILM